MSNLKIRPATAADFNHFSKEWPTAAAIVGVLDGVPIGIGGIAFVAGRCVAFCDVKPEARKYKLAIHKAALAVMRQAKASGRRVIYAQTDPDEAHAPRWLAALGFERDEETEVWTWRR